MKSFEFSSVCCTVVVTFVGLYFTLALQPLIRALWGFVYLWIVSTILLAMFELGMTVGFLSCLLPALKSSDSGIKASLEDISWIAASFNLACIPGFLTSSIYMDRFGRRVAFILDIIPGAIGLLLMYFATNVYTLIAARIFQGITAGSTTVLGAIVIGEYTSPSHRGMFLNMKTAALYAGSALIHFLGSFFNWRTLLLITLAPYIINLVMIWTWPESPAWLAKGKKYEECTKIFLSLRGKNEEAVKELNGMIKTQQEHIGLPKQSFSQKTMTFFRKFGQRDFGKPVIIFVFAAILLETTGRHVYPAFAIQIISEISGEPDPFYLTLGLDILITVSACFSSALIRMAKRRTLLFTTGFVSCLVLISACTYLYLASIDIITNITWIPMTLFGLYIAIVNFACAPIPLALVGEIFPLDHRAASTMIAGVLISSTSIVTYKTFPYLLATVKIYGTFFIFGIVMAISLVFLYFFLPETKDRSLVEIEHYFNYGSFEDDRKKEDDEAAVKMLPL